MVVHRKAGSVGLEVAGVVNCCIRLVCSVVSSSWGNLLTGEIACSCSCSGNVFLASSFAAGAPLFVVSSCPTGPCSFEPFSSSMCFSTSAKCWKPSASFLYLASSAPRLGPETCTRISVGRLIAALHLGLKQTVASR